MSISVDKQVGQQIARLRRLAGLSEDVCAAALNLKAHQYLAAEAGERRLKAAELFTLAQLLNCKMADIFSHFP